MPDSHVPFHKRIFRLLKAAVEEFGNDMASRFAAALSFYTLFALVPLLFLLVAVVGFVSSDSVLVGEDCAVVAAAMIPDAPANPLDRAIAQVDEVAGNAVSDQFAQLTCLAAENASAILWIGIGLAAFSGSSIFLHIQGVLNYIFHVPEERTRGLVNAITSRGIALAWAALLAVIVLIPLVAVAGVNFIQNLIDAPWLRNVLGIAVPLTSLFMLVTVVALTFQLLTRAKVPGKAARRGGLFTALVGLVGAFLVGFYLSTFGTGGALGAIGGVAILLFFFNLMWIIYLFGAEVTKVYADFLEHGDVKAPSQREDDARQATALVGTVDPRAESPLRNGVMAFLIGLVTGWAARRKL
ncbi:MAG: YihY/virulence factor BrkB family protein [Acidimicrobiia bacterium]